MVRSKYVVIFKAAQNRYSYKERGFSHSGEESRLRFYEQINYRRMHLWSYAINNRRSTLIRRNDWYLAPPPLPEPDIDAQSHCPNMLKLVIPQ